MAELKTKQNTASVTAFLGAVVDRQQRADAKKISAMMRTATESRAKMWGTSIVGFGSYHYKYDSGREGDFMLVGFSPRKSNLTVYIITGFSRYASLMKKLGRFKTGKSCLYLKTLEDVDFEVLTELVTLSSEHVVAKYD